MLPSAAASLSTLKLTVLTAVFCYCKLVATETVCCQWRLLLSVMQTQLCPGQSLRGEQCAQLAYSHAAHEGITRATPPECSPGDTSSLCAHSLAVRCPLSIGGLCLPLGASSLTPLSILSLLYKMMLQIDSSSGQPRGCFFVLPVARTATDAADWRKRRETVALTIDFCLQSLSLCVCKQYTLCQLVPSTTTELTIEKRKEQTSKKRATCNQKETESVRRRLLATILVAYY